MNGPTLVFALAVVALAAVACGGAESSAPAKAPSREVEGTSKDEISEPRTVEEAQERIARARASLEGDGDEQADHLSGARPAESPPPRAPETSASGPREERVEDACASPCRALASMRRAVLALCRMTGETDDRCVGAKRTLAESTTRVARCKCEAR